MECGASSRFSSEACFRSRERFTNEYYLIELRLRAHPRRFAPPLQRGRGRKFGFTLPSPLAGEGPGVRGTSLNLVILNKVTPAPSLHSRPFAKEQRTGSERHRPQ